MLAALGLVVAGALVVAMFVAMTTSVAPVATGPKPGDRPEAPSGAGYALWARAADGDPLRWDACAPIGFVLNPAGAPPEAEEDLRAALRMLAEASGLDLALLGRGQERPHVERPLVEPAGSTWRWRPVLVAWARPGEGALPLTPFDRGVALPVAVRDGDREAYVTGQVVLNADRDDLVPGFSDRRDAIGATLVHEIAHVLGLDHVDDPGELMWDEPGSGPVVLGPGDVAGLRAVGAAAGCRAAPDATSGRGLTVRR